MKIQIAEVECSLMTFGALVDCEPRLCFLCSHHQPGDFREEEVTPLELRNLIRTNKYVIKNVQFQ